MHIDDPDFYETIYSQAGPLDKPRSIEHRLNAPHSAFSTADSSLHRLRRTALNPFLSTRRVYEHESLIKSKVNQVCAILTDEYAGKGKVLTLNDLFGCLMADLVMEVAFGDSYNLIATKDFVHPFTMTTAKAVGMAHYFTHVPWLLTLTNWLPEELLMSWFGGFRPIILLRQVRTKVILGSWYLLDVLGTHR